MLLGTLLAVAYRFDDGAPQRVLSVDFEFDTGTWGLRLGEYGVVSFRQGVAEAANSPVSDCFPWPRVIGEPARSGWLTDDAGRAVGVQFEFGDPAAQPRMAVQLRERMSRVEINAVYALETPLRAVARKSGTEREELPAARFRLTNDRTEPLTLGLEPTGMMFDIGPGDWVDIESSVDDGQLPELHAYDSGLLVLWGGWRNSAVDRDGTLWE
ncbi:hypothetical protein H0264_28020 [Nocardia huaxiensis]|uniref:Uncharacterized protein n=1 Tax=Nocardia huaxiensis TaxID=2755382 RepID=A0A7D6V715_9NOCA|nr:hypothetical protein [Nocardia huaxiensis]QLY29121.1 hypothetical protein H0264_28020 [Nocardia huaxiensis]